MKKGEVGLKPIEVKVVSSRQRRLSVEVVPPHWQEFLEDNQEVDFRLRQQRKARIRIPAIFNR